MVTLSGLLPPIGAAAALQLHMTEYRKMDESECLILVVAILVPVTPAETDGKPQNQPPKDEFPTRRDEGDKNVGAYCAMDPAYGAGWDHIFGRNGGQQVN